MQFNNRRFEDYMPKTYGKPLKSKFTKDYQIKEVESRTPAARTKTTYDKQLKKLKEERKRNINSGLSTEEIDNQIRTLRINYKKRLVDIRTKKEDESDFPFVPTPFFSDKLEINKAIDEDDIE
jgi:hypothetical protein